MTAGGVHRPAAVAEFERRTYLPHSGNWADESESVAGWAEIICEDGANVRLSPGGEYKTWLPKGIRVQKIGQTSIANGLVWEEITGGLYIARADSTGTVMLEDIE